MPALFLFLARWRTAFIIVAAVVRGVSNAWAYWQGWFARVEHKRKIWSKECAQLMSDASQSVGKLDRTSYGRLKKSDFSC